MIRGMLMMFLMLSFPATTYFTTMAEQVYLGAFQIILKSSGIILR